MGKDVETSEDCATDPLNVKIIPVHDLYGTKAENKSNIFLDFHVYSSKYNIGRYEI
jgi:hypothetical protein